MLRRAHSDNRPPRSFVLSVRTRIAQWQREEPSGGVEALTGRAQRGQPAPTFSFRATGQTLHAQIFYPLPFHIDSQLHFIPLNVISMYTTTI